MSDIQDRVIIIQTLAAFAQQGIIRPAEFELAMDGLIRPLYTPVEETPTITGFRFAGDVDEMGMLDGLMEEIEAAKADTDNVIQFPTKED